jgi:hypothetical protein
MSTITLASGSVIEQVPASELRVGDRIGGTKTDTRKAVVTGEHSWVIGAITSDPSGSRIQARTADGKMIRSFDPETTAWRATEGAAPESTDAPEAEAAPAKKKSTTKKGQKKVATTTEAPESTNEFTWPKPAGEVLLSYLTENVSDAAEAPNQGLPFITADGTLRIRSEHWREWLVAQGIAPSKMEATKPIRELGFAMKPYALPGEGRSHGFYTGPAPEGTESLARRAGGRGPRTARPFGTLTDTQRQALTEALTGAKLKGELADARDELLAQL